MINTTTGYKSTMWHIAHGLSWLKMGKHKYNNIKIVANLQNGFYNNCTLHTLHDVTRMK